METVYRADKDGLTVYVQPSAVESYEEAGWTVTEEEFEPGGEQGSAAPPEEEGDQA